MKYLMFSFLLLAACAVQKPKVNTPAPALTATKQATHDAKDFLSRATNTNSEIDKELEGLEKDLELEHDINTP